jgi:hypothetical protein
MDPCWKRTLYQSLDLARTATFPPDTLVTLLEFDDGPLRTTTFFPIMVPRPSGAGPLEAVILGRRVRVDFDFDDFLEELDDATRVDFLVDFRADFADPLLEL